MVLPTPPASVAAPDGIVSLVVDGTPRRFLLFDPTFVGNSEDCPVRLFGPGVAPIHCKLRRHSGRWMVEVEAGASDIEVNGRRVRFSRLSPGDVIGVSGVELRFHLATEYVTDEPPRIHKAVEPSLEAVARKAAELDVALAAVASERLAWESRLEHDRKELERSRQEWQWACRNAEAATRQQQAQWESEQEAIRGALAEREQALAEREKALDAREEALTTSRREQEQAADELREVQLQRAETLRVRRQSAQRLFALANQRMRGLVDEKRAAADEREQVESAHRQIVSDISVRQAELHGLCERIARERSLLVQIQRQRTRAITASKPALAHPENVSTIFVDESRTAPPNGEPRMALLTDELERIAEALADTDRRQCLQANRLAELARQIESRERVLAQGLAPRSRDATTSVGIAAERQDLARQLAAFQREKTRWEHVLGLELASMRRQRDRVHEQRQRNLVVHEKRSKQLRARMQRLRQERRALDLRFGQSLRLEERLEALRQDLITRHVEELKRKTAPAVEHAVPSLTQIAVLRQEQQTHRQNYESRLHRILDVVERSSSADGWDSWLPDSRSMESDERDVESFLLQAQFDADRRHWSRERKQYQSTIVAMESQIENLAACLIGDGKAMDLADHRLPSAA